MEAKNLPEQPRPSSNQRQRLRAPCLSATQRPQNTLSGSPQPPQPPIQGPNFGDGWGRWASLQVGLAGAQRGATPFGPFALSPCTTAPQPRAPPATNFSFFFFSGQMKPAQAEKKQPKINALWTYWMPNWCATLCGKHCHPTATLHEGRNFQPLSPRVVIAGLPPSFFTPPSPSVTSPYTVVGCHDSKPRRFVETLNQPACRLLHPLGVVLSSPCDT